VDGRPVALDGQPPQALGPLLALTGGRVVCDDRLVGEEFGCGAGRWTARIASAASAVHSPFVVL